MKILVVSQNFYPEQFRINDICVELVNRGHDVTVLTGLPNYPQGKLYAGYEKKQKRNEVYNGVNIIRVYERERKSGGAINLFLNYYSFRNSALRYVKKLDKDFDVVFVYQISPVMQAEAALKYKKLYGVPVILYCLDLWPASLQAGGLKPSSLIYKHYEKVSKKIYNACDKILVSSKMFLNYFENDLKINKNKIEYLPQYAEDMFIACDENVALQKANVYNFVFAGNVGKMQNVELIIDVAKELAEKPVLFHIVGGGSRLEKCKERAQGLNNVKFYGQLPLSQMPSFYNLADAMLVTLCKNDLISLTLPGKVQTYMAAGKPIIASGDNELKRVIDEAQCGFISPADDKDGLKQNILNFIECNDKKALAKNSRLYYEGNFTKEKFFEKLNKELENGHI